MGHQRRCVFSVHRRGWWALQALGQTRPVPRPSTGLATAMLSVRVTSILPTGAANSGQWAEPSSDPNASVRQYGSCCAEMDIWCVYPSMTDKREHPSTDWFASREANSFSTAYIPHLWQPLLGSIAGRATPAAGPTRPSATPERAIRMAATFNAYRQGCQ